MFGLDFPTKFMVNLIPKMSEERHDADSDSDHDSGNDEPTENAAENGAAAERVKRDLSPGQLRNEPNSNGQDDNDDDDNRALIPSASRSGSEPRDAVFHPGQHYEEPLHCRHHLNHHDAVRGSKDNRHFGESGSSDLVQNFPPEVLMAIFSFLVSPCI